MGKPEQKISIQPGYVLVERQKDYEVVWTDRQEELKAISAACKEAGCRNVLIRGPRTKVRLSVVDLYNLGQELAELGLRFALVESHDVSNNEVEFLKNVTMNRGGSIQFFNNEEDAKAWLGIRQP